MHSIAAILIILRRRGLASSVPVDPVDTDIPTLIFATVGAVDGEPDFRAALVEAVAGEPDHHLALVEAL